MCALVSSTWQMVQIWILIFAGSVIFFIFNRLSTGAVTGGGIDEVDETGTGTVIEGATGRVDGGGRANGDIGRILNGLNIDGEVLIHDLRELVSVSLASLAAPSLPAGHHWSPTTDIFCFCL